METNLTKWQITYLKAYNFEKNLILWWPPWTWKTHTAEKLLKKYWNDKFTYQIWDAYFKELLASWGLKLRKPEEFACWIEAYPLEMMIKAKVLLYDDLWVSDATEAYLRKINFVLDERNNRKLITIFTTNFQADGLQVKLNERIKSRIFYNADTLDINWKDLRNLSTNKNIK